MLLRGSVLTAIELEGYFCFSAEEVEHIAADWMFPAKFITGKATVAEQSPEAPLRLGHCLAEVTSASGGVHGRKRQFVRTGAVSPLTPPLSPLRGEGEDLGRLCCCRHEPRGIRRSGG